MYQKRNIGELGNLEFIGNIGALAEFEDIIGAGFSEVIKENEVPRLNIMLTFLFACHKVAMARQGKSTDITLEQFKANADFSIMELFSIMLGDAMKSGNPESIEKKIPKTAKN